MNSISTSPCIIVCLLLIRISPVFCTLNYIPLVSKQLQMGTALQCCFHVCRLSRHGTQVQTDPIAEIMEGVCGCNGLWFICVCNKICRSFLSALPKLNTPLSLFGVSDEAQVLYSCVMQEGHLCLSTPGALSCKELLALFHCLQCELKASSTLQDQGIRKISWNLALEL